MHLQFLFRIILEKSFIALSIFLKSKEHPFFFFFVEQQPLTYEIVAFALPLTFINGKPN